MAVLHGFVGSTTVSDEAAPAPISSPAPALFRIIISAPNQNRMLRRLVGTACPSNPKGSQGRRFETLNTEPSFSVNCEFETTS